MREGIAEGVHPNAISSPCLCADDFFKETVTLLICPCGFQINAVGIFCSTASLGLSPETLCGCQQDLPADPLKSPLPRVAHPMLAEVLAW
jgi:hypothetical protein